MKIKSTLSLFLIFLSGMALAQDSLSTKNYINVAYIEQHIRNASFSYVSPHGEYGAPDPYILTSNFNTTFLAFASPNSRLAFTVTPEVEIRVRKEHSSGVRTPSYRIAGLFHYRISNDINTYKILELGFTHHSNGQDGEAINPDGSLNTVTGNFTTNFIVANFRFGNFPDFSGSHPILSINHLAGIQIHRLFKFERAISEDYGFTKLMYQFSLRKYDLSNKKGKYKTNNYKETWRLNGVLSYAINKIDGYELFDVKKRINTEVNFNYSFPFMGNTYLMAAAGYYGEDPYNIYYRNHYGYIRLGFSANIAAFMSGKY